MSKQPLEVEPTALEKWADGGTLSKRDLISQDDRDSDDSDE